MSSAIHRATRLSRVFAILEFVGVFLAGIVAQRLVSAALGLPSWKATQAEMLGGEADFLRLSQLAAAELFLRYGAMVGLAVALGWWLARRPLAHYGVTRSGRGLPELLRIGVVLWAVGKLVAALLLALDDHLPWIGRGPDHWALFPSTWTVEFLLYMAVSSFLLVPIVEELAFRGYMIGRLREDYGEAGALVLATVFFTVAHTQYFRLELLSLGMSVSLLVGSVSAGYVLLRTGSLLPCVVAHALANLPMPPGRWSEEVLLAMVVAVLVVARREVAGWARDGLELLRNDPSRGATVLGVVLLVGCLAIVLVFEDRSTTVALVFLLIAVLGQLRLRRYSAASSGGGKESAEARPNRSGSDRS